MLKGCCEEKFVAIAARPIEQKSHGSLMLFAIFEFGYCLSHILGRN
jgi:hypothetical protein